MHYVRTLLFGKNKNSCSKFTLWQNVNVAFRLIKIYSLIFFNSYDLLYLSFIYEDYSRSKLNISNSIDTVNSIVRVIFLNMNLTRSFQTSILCTFSAKPFLLFLLNIFWTVDVYMCFNLKPLNSMKNTFCYNI